MKNSIKTFINCFRGIKLKTINLVNEYIEYEEMCCKIKCIFPDIKNESIKDLVEWANKKYSETPFKNIGIRVLEELYMNLSSGLLLEDSIIVTKAFVIKDIQNRNIKRMIEESKRVFEGLI